MGEVQLHAIVDGKKIVIIESIVRRDLQLEDAEGVDCLPNATIFEQLALMGVESSGDEEVLDDVDMFDVNTLTGDEVLAEQEVAAKDVNLIVDEVTLAQALTTLKIIKPKVKANVIKELSSVPVSAANVSTKVSAVTTTTATIPTPRKGIVITKLGTSTTTRTIYSQQPSQAKVQDKRKGIMGKDEAIVPTEEVNDIQAKLRAFKRVNTFVDFRTDLVEGSSKRAGDGLE
ncbi:hypothetical protein Tco_0774924 [Tanacetum coccineum]|uniref:Uncharacterized protein n=1 Tax=Tanacetum coccineum TaxID=301880 RepID=A0ABQ4ZU71_9ASTR